MIALNKKQNKGIYTPCIKVKVIKHEKLQLFGTTNNPTRTIYKCVLMPSDRQLQLVTLMSAFQCPVGEWLSAFGALERFLTCVLSAMLF